jgi:hypothetical protein
MRMWKKSIMAGALAWTCLAGTAFAYEANTAIYPDLARDDWSRDAVYTLSVLGVVSGYEDASFRPEQEITREAFIKMLMAAAKPSLPALAQGGGEQAPAYSDLAVDRWSYPYMAEAESLDLLSFMSSGGRIEPDKPPLREEVAALAGKYLLQLEGNRGDQTKLAAIMEEESSRRSFQDAERIDPKLAEALYYAAYKDVMAGDDTGSFRPKDTLSRKQAAAIIYRLLDNGLRSRPLELNGFYAIKSYASRGHIADLDRIIYGWSNLDYSAETGGKLNVISTEYKIPEGSDEVLELADQNGLQKELMIYASGSELKGFLKDPSSWSGFIASVRTIVEDSAQPYDGICIDFEGLLEEEYREPFSQFIEELRKALRSGTSLTAAIPPATYYKGYDMGRIGQVVDRVVLMAYDFTHAESRLPSAPLTHVQEALEELLKVVPKDKIILGVSKQANQWVTDGATGEVQLYHPAIELVESRLKAAGTEVSVEAPYFLTRITYRNGGGSSEIWYEDENSIAKKLWLARYYGLKGVSFWHMGLLTDRDWTLIRGQ